MNMDEEIVRRIATRDKLLTRETMRKKASNTTIAVGITCTCAGELVCRKHGQGLWLNKCVLIIQGAPEEME